jgi:hypothetical protein
LTRSWLFKLFILGLAIVQAFYTFGPMVLNRGKGLVTLLAQSDSDQGDKYAFLPIMLVSVYCALGVVWAFASYYVSCLILKEDKKE